MANKQQRNRGEQVENEAPVVSTDAGTVSTAPEGGAPAAVEPQPAAGPNFVLTFRRNHPGNRCSYGVNGNAGIVVFDRGLVAGTVPTTGTDDLGGMPTTITLDTQLVPVKLDNKSAKAEAAAAKLVERARKAQEKIVAAQAKAEEKKAKAEAALAAAKAKVEAAQAAKAAEAAASTPTT